MSAGAGLSNPLLVLDDAVPYGRVRAEDVLPAVHARLAAAAALEERVLSDPSAPTWDQTIAPIEAVEDELDYAWRPAEHLGRMRRDEAMREAARQAKALVTAHRVRLAQDDRLLARAREVMAVETPRSPERRRAIEVLVRDLIHGGAGLDTAGRARLAEIRLALIELSTRYQENITDATDAARLVIDDPAAVAPLPEGIRAAAAALAARELPDAPGPRWSFTLDQPTLSAFLMHQPDRRLRERIFTQFYQIASAPPHDNGPLAVRIVALRLEMARLLGAPSYAALALSSEMAGSPEVARAFLQDLAARARPAAERDRDALLARARADGLDELGRHDLGYYREQLRAGSLGLVEQEIRQYFPLPRVLDGLLQVISRLFGLDARRRPAGDDPRAWHPDVIVLELREPGGPLVAEILLDLYVRPGKTRGGWTTGALVGGQPELGPAPHPVGIIGCNFPAPTGDRPSLLSHDNVRTLFHELGHALHHGLTRVRERRTAGLRGVARDAIEVPSKLFEGWIWRPEVLELISGHVETGAPLPADLAARLLAGRNLLRALDMTRQIEHSLFDLELYAQPEAMDLAGLRALLASVRARVAVIPAGPEDRFECGFHHIFAGGYASTYYGYAWSEALASDAFTRWEEEGVFSRAAGDDLRRHLLSRGGSVDPMAAFIAFRGRRPDPGALLRQCGLA